ncbi:hypothetical protein H7171_03770, partial [Candidatus Saccharibacteria bacterium]|nr:hypothetical protein [Candidatus Saccharibacteria bacterium]
TSDEWSNDASIGIADADNLRLGQERAEAARTALIATGAKIPDNVLVITEKEQIITPEQKATLTAEALTEGYPNLSAAISAVDSGRAESSSLTNEIKTLFTGAANRGVNLRATIQQPNKDVTTDITIPAVDNAPNIPTPHFIPAFVPLLPFRRLEKYTAYKQVKKWVFTPAKKVMRPHIIREEVEQAWLRIRPDAVKEDNTLVQNPWAYTRKYEHLLRDDRIADLLRADFTNSKGEAKSLRVMFVDISPAQETIDAFSALLTKFASMEDGKIADRISGIFVYPEENSGTEHADPKRIALGIDKQSSSDILGTLTYALDLVELHMPTTWNAEELDETFKSFYGPIWTTAHEVAGHGTDESDSTLRLRRVHTSGIPQAHIIQGEPRARKMKRIDRVLRNLSKRNSPLEFDVSYQAVDKNGNTVTIERRVEETDAVMTHATQSTIVDHKPTGYAGTNDSEHYAETAASVTTGIEIPYKEAEVNVRPIVDDNGNPTSFAEGYRPDVRGQTVFTSSVGADVGSFPVAFSRPLEVTVSHINPANDPVIREHMIRSRNARILRPEQMIAILARVTKRGRA